MLIATIIIAIGSIGLLLATLKGLKGLKGFVYKKRNNNNIKSKPEKTKKVNISE